MLSSIRKTLEVYNIGQPSSIQVGQGANTPKKPSLEQHLNMVREYNLQKKIMQKM